MGKSKQSKTKAGSSSISNKKCTCEHLYQCDCGNRPERPSRGHRWDQESQQWGGKGHKQKGGSGQTSMVGQEARVTEKGKTQLAQWQKLPSGILRDYCIKQKRPPPKFKELLNDKTKFKCRVICPDSKTNRDKDLILIPAKAVQNEEQAQEEAALLALLHLTPKLPHERKLPEPYRTTWLSAVSQQKSDATATRMKEKDKDINNSNSGNKIKTSNGTNGIHSNTGASSNTNLTLGTAFTSHSGKRKLADEKRKNRNARIHKHEAIRMANRDHPVFLSAKLRNSIQKILRGDFVDLLSNNNDEDDAALSKFDSDLQHYVEERLHQEGFTKRQARTVYEQKGKGKTTIDEEYWDQVYDDCLQWLCVHLEEDQLPEGFDPRGSTLEVVAAQNSTNTGGAGKNSGVASVIADKFGMDIQDASWLLQQQQNQQKDATTEKSLESIFWSQICKIANVHLSEENYESHGNENENKEMAQEEYEATEAMFQSDCASKTDKDGKSSTILIKTPEMMDIYFTFSPGIYPSVFPTSILFLGKWERPVGVSFHVKIAKFLSTLPLGDPMLFEIYGEAQNILQSLEDLPCLPLSTISVPKFIEKESSGAHSSSSLSKKITPIETTKAKSIRRRPRARSVFWSIPPKKTTPATSFCWSKSIERQRKSLPAWKARDSFLSKLSESCKSSRVLLVTGDTGCGKTTQIPQFILEENPISAKIVVAQPRRLAATGVAGRVAEERGENQPGKASVGYVVRGASAFSKDTRLLFCTFGILLRQLQSEGALDSITHIVIDEVHERNLDGDILMGLLRESLKTVPHLKVILMSATLDADRFAAYWGDAPRLHIPGRTFPVVDFMLEDVLQRTGYNPPKKKRKQVGFNYRPQNRRASPWNDSEKSDDEMDAVDEKDTSTTLKNTKDSEAKEPGVSLEERVKRVDQTSVDYFLLAFLVKYIVQSNEMGSDGSILVFLQGVGEISQAKTIVGNITKGMPILLLSLHGSLPPQEQSKIFRNTPGQIKVILSTNVAETSITIPDCTVVIDSCREKQSSYDPINRMPHLLDQFASKASLKQRRGRAGRVRSGKCYKLISKATFSKLNDDTAPEISRCALDQTLLSLLFLGAEDGSGRFLQKLLDPPSQISVNAAAASLQKMGALEQVQSGKLCLSPLGMHLAGIPAPPAIGKLLVMGSILGCRTGALAMAAGLSVGRSPFLRVDGRSNGEDKDKNQLILEERSKLFVTCGNSDHSMIAAAFMNWQNLPNGSGRRKWYCESLGLSFNGMRDIAQLVTQYGSSLSVSGFPSSIESDRNAQSWRVLRTCAIAAMAPEQLVRIFRPSTKYEDTAEGAKLKEGEAKGHKFYIRVDKGEDNIEAEKQSQERVFIHPSSNLFSVGTYGCPWLVFHSMIRTSKPFLRDATECSAYALLLFGGPLSVEARNSTIHIDGWVRLSANAKIGALIQGLRSKMDELLRKKIENPTMSISNTPEMQLIVKLVITDGLG